MDIGASLPALLTGVGAIVWSIRQEGRLNGHDIMFRERERADKHKVEEANRRHAETLACLHSIKQRMDEVVDHMIQSGNWHGK